MADLARRGPAEAGLLAIQVGEIDGGHATLGELARQGGVTVPREIIPGRYWLVTRRCTQRQYFLRPGKATTDIFNYCLAEAAAVFGVELLAWSTMSNHFWIDPLRG